MQHASTHHCKLSCDQTRESQPRPGPSLAPSSPLQPEAQLTVAPEQPGPSSPSPSSGLQCSRGRDRAAAQRGPCLFAFPLESNFSGERYDPAVVNQIQNQGLLVADHAQQEEENPQRQVQKKEETQNPGQPQSDLQTLSMHDQQYDHKQRGGEAEAQQAVQGLTWEEEHRQHQPAAEEAAEGLSGHRGCKEEARRLPSRPSQSESDRWHVLIDAAKACATTPPDLTKHPADFVVRLSLIFHLFPDIIYIIIHIVIHRSASLKHWQASVCVTYCCGRQSGAFSNIRKKPCCCCP